MVNGCEMDIHTKEVSNVLAQNEKKDSYVSDFDTGNIVDDYLVENLVVEDLALTLTEKETS